MRLLNSLGGAAWRGLFCALCLSGLRLDAADAPSTEYELKAGYLFNFAKYVHWPASAFPYPSTPIQIGVLGTDPFGEALNHVVDAKLIEGRPIVIKRYGGMDDFTKAHILFISRSERPRLREIIGQLKGSSVLTVSELGCFAEAGGMITFFTEGRTIRFQINLPATQKAGLKLSSKLLRVGDVSD